MPVACRRMSVRKLSKFCELFLEGPDVSVCVCAHVVIIGCAFCRLVVCAFAVEREDEVNWRQAGSVELWGMAQVKAQ